MNEIIKPVDFERDVVEWKFAQQTNNHEDKREHVLADMNLTVPDEVLINEILYLILQKKVKQQNLKI